MTWLAGPARKAALTLHVAVSVGWLGAVAAFLAMAIVGLASPDAERARSSYVAMDLVARSVIVPFCFASLVTGLVQGLGTKWGLFRHYWIVLKLAINVLSTIVLLMHMQPIAALGAAALAGPLAPDAHAAMRLQLVVNAAAALVALGVATTLAVVKPRGLTPRGQRATAAR